MGSLTLAHTSRRWLVGARPQGYRPPTSWRRDGSAGRRLWSPPGGGYGPPPGGSYGAPPPGWRAAITFRPATHGIRRCWTDRQDCRSFGGPHRRGALRCIPLLNALNCCFLHSELDWRRSRASPCSSKPIPARTHVGQRRRCAVSGARPGLIAGEAHRRDHAARLEPAPSSGGDLPAFFTKTVPFAYSRMMLQMTQHGAAGIVTDPVICRFLHLRHARRVPYTAVVLQRTVNGRGVRTLSLFRVAAIVVGLLPWVLVFAPGAADFFWPTFHSLCHQRPERTLFFSLARRW